ncbi:MAG: phospholipase [Pirellulaceae bacterium]|nr:phospholipase [Pirellulaceae bacterium]
MSSTTSNHGVSVLSTLHRIHRQLTDLRGRLDRGPRRIQAAEGNVKRNEEALEHARTESKSLRMTADQKQLQLKTGEQRIADLRLKLNAASSNREYQALLEQIAAAEMANSVLTDEILEKMEEADAFLKNVADAESSLAAARKKAEEVRAEVVQQEPLLKADVERLEAELLPLESKLPGDILELYKRIVRQKGEDALAAVENQCCGGCHQQVPLNICSQIMMGQPVACRTCGRLLYVPE